jgi:hypothetical protein
VRCSNSKVNITNSSLYFDEYSNSTGMYFYDNNDANVNSCIISGFVKGIEIYVGNNLSFSDNVIEGHVDSVSTPTMEYAVSAPLCGQSDCTLSRNCFYGISEIAIYVAPTALFDFGVSPDTSNNHFYAEGLNNCYPEYFIKQSSAKGQAEQVDAENNRWNLDVDTLYEEELADKMLGNIDYDPWLSDNISPPCEPPSQPQHKITIDYEEEVSLPQEYCIRQNYPNPFNPVTSIEYALPEGCQVLVEVFNVLGQRVKVLVDEYQTAGTYTIVWDGTDEGEKTLASGMYFYRMKAGTFVSAKKMIIMK